MTLFPWLLLCKEHNDWRCNCDTSQHIIYTRDPPREDGLLLLVVAVPQGDAGAVGHRLPDVGSVDQVSQVLHPDGGCPLPHGEAQGVHHIGLAWKIFFKHWL